MTPRRASVLVAALALAASGCNLADTLVMWPPSGAAGATGAERKVISSSGKDLEIWRVPGAHRPVSAYVLRFYGNGDRAEWNVADEAARYPGVEIWAVNYPGYGGSEGPATLSGAAASALAAYDALAVEAAGRPILAFGTSLGTTAALHVAANRQVGGVLLVNPPPLRELVLGHYGWWNLWLLASWTAVQVPPELDSVHNAQNCRAPAVFVTAEEDEIVPPEYQQRIFWAYAGPKAAIIVRGGTHNSGAPPETERRIAAAVERMISGASSGSTGDSSRPRRSSTRP